MNCAWLAVLLQFCTSFLQYLPTERNVKLLVEVARALHVLVATLYLSLQLHGACLHERVRSECPTRLSLALGCVFCCSCVLFATTQRMMPFARLIGMLQSHERDKRLKFPCEGIARQSMWWSP